MGVRARFENGDVRVILDRWDRVLTMRRSVEFVGATIKTATVAHRASLEPKIDHRVLGWGTHDGARRPNRRRVGTMLGRGVTGNQFWAVAAGPGSDSLLVLDLTDHEFSRAVLWIPDPESVVSELSKPPHPD